MNNNGAEKRKAAQRVVIAVFAFSYFLIVISQMHGIHRCNISWE